MKGEVRIERMLESDAVFESGRRVILRMGTERQDGQDEVGHERESEIEFFRRQHGRCLAKLRGIDSISEAEKYVGGEIRVPATELPALAEGSFYTFQLKGCRVFAAGGHMIGIVSDVIHAGGPEILKVDFGNQETLIPFAQSYLKSIDVDLRRIEVDLPDDLRNLNK